MRNTLRKTLLATAAGVATLVGGHAAASADTVDVQAGDTLSGIAQANNTTAEELAQANQISDKNLIIEGQQLTVSAPKVSSISADGTTYIVQTGDTLSKVAQQTGIDVTTLVNLNNLSSDNLVLAGQELTLKQAQTAIVPTVTATEQQSVATSTQADNNQILTEQVAYIAAADTDKDGFMSAAEYNAYKANGGNITPASEVAAEQVQTTQSAQTVAPVAQDVQYIAAADTNKDSYMSAEEYATYQANGGQAQQAQQAQVTQVSTSAATPAESSDVQALVNSLNAKRASLGLSPVTLDANLAAQAQSRAQNAAANGGIPTNHFSTNGEVVAVGFSTGSVIDAWFNETNMMTPNGQPGHRMWVANSRASAVGFGIVGDVIVGVSDAGQF